MIQEIKLCYNDIAQGEFKYCPEGPGEDMYLPFNLERKRTFFSKVDAKIVVQFEMFFNPKRTWLFEIVVRSGIGRGV